MFPPRPSRLRLAVECLVLFGGTAFVVVAAAALSNLH